MRSERTLFAARDRFGIKPLFYAWHNNALYIASEVKALFAAGVPARWDEESVYQSFTFGGHQMRTLYDGVHLVPPGHYLIATEKHFQVTRYWDFNYPRRERCCAEDDPTPTMQPSFAMSLKRQCASVCVPMCRWASI